MPAQEDQETRFTSLLVFIIACWSLGSAEKIDLFDWFSTGSGHQSSDQALKNATE